MKLVQNRQGWWLWSVNPVSILLVPLSLLFYLLSCLRRLAYRLHILKSTPLPVTTIVVGNITLGGNGKTPVVMALFQLLQDRGYRPAIITRGYKSGNERKIQILSDGKIDEGVGDEANMISEICRCPIGVGSNRVAAALQILDQYPEINVIISDDGLQHYALRRDIDIAVYRHVAFGNGLLIPAGPLREPRGRLKDFDVTVNRDGDQIIESLGKAWNLANPEQECDISDFKERQVHALAGIGFPELFFASLRQPGLDLIEHVFPDHHQFTAEELILNPDLPILITHKDSVKLRGLARDNIWVVPLNLELSGTLQDRLFQLLESRHHG